jgi:hypothetical protein
MNSSKEPLAHCMAVVAVEVDLVRDGGGRTSWAPLDRDAASRIGEAIAPDLARLLPGVEALGLTLGGALYDQTQLLAPGWPVFDELAEIYLESLGGTPFKPRLVTIGSADGAMPKSALIPLASTTAGPLVMMPLTLTGPEEPLQAIVQQMEECLADQGTVSAETALALQEVFAVRVVHARYMTVNDVCALLTLQFDHLGLNGLWRILEMALFQPTTPVWELTGYGAGFYLENGQAEAIFQTFDQWAQAGAGADLPSDRHQLGAGYAAYQREQRQYLLTLLAHGIDVVLVNFTGRLPETLEQWLEVRSQATRIDQDYLVEETVAGEPVGHCHITEQAATDLGTVAFTVEHLDQDGSVTQRINYYPVRADGQKQIERFLVSHRENHSAMAYSGFLCYDPEQRMLIADPALEKL